VTNHLNYGTAINRLKDSDYISIPHRDRSSNYPYGAESFLKKPTAAQPLKKFPAVHGNRRFIIKLTRDCHCSLTWAIHT
jgi:hypothetical protein